MMRISSRQGGRRVDLVLGLPADARGAPHAGSAVRSGGDGVLFADDYESPAAACIAL